MNIPAFTILCLMALSINQVAPYSGYWDSWNQAPVYEQTNYGTGYDQYGDYHGYDYGYGASYSSYRSLEDPLEEAKGE